MDGLWRLLLRIFVSGFAEHKNVVLHKIYACYVCLSACRQRLGDNYSINVQRIHNNITAGQIKMHSNVRLYWLGWLERPQATGRAGGKGIEAVG